MPLLKVLWWCVQAVCGSVLESQLDQHIVTKIFSDHLNEKMLSRVTATAASRPSSSTDRRLTPSTLAPTSPTQQSSTSLTPASTSSGSALTLSARPSLHVPTILLHSLPSGGGVLTLPLNLDPNQAISVFSKFSFYVCREPIEFIVQYLYCNGKNLMN